MSFYLEGKKMLGMSSSMKDNMTNQHICNTCRSKKGMEFGEQAIMTQSLFPGNILLDFILKRYSGIYLTDGETGERLLNTQHRLMDNSKHFILCRRGKMQRTCTLMAATRFSKVGLLTEDGDDVIQIKLRMPACTDDHHVFCNA